LTHVAHEDCRAQLRLSWAAKNWKHFSHNISPPPLYFTNRNASFWDEENVSRVACLGHPKLVKIILSAFRNFFSSRIGTFCRCEDCQAQSKLPNVTYFIEEIISKLVPVLI
jgi:hypothetical protein